MLYSDHFLFIFIKTTYIIKLSICLCSEFSFCFINPDYRLILMTSPPLPQLKGISEGLL
jgi:hypothetical protein